MTTTSALPAARPPARPAARRALLLVGVTIAYVAAAWIGLRFAMVDGAVSLLWPPTGLALAALTLWGRRMWPAVALGAVIGVRGLIGLSWFATILMAAGCTLEAWLGATILSRRGFRPAMDRVRDASLLVACAALAPVVAATAGTIALCVFAGVPWSALPAAWATWWAGDAMSVLVVTPMLLAWLVPRAQSAPGRPAERAIALAGLAAASLLAFFRPESARQADAVLALTIFPFVAWLALRFTHRAAAGGVVGVAAIAIVATGLGRGPFAVGSPIERSVLLQVFLTVTALAALALSSAVSGQRRAEAQREESLALMKEFSDSLHHAAWISELPDGRLLWASPAFERLFGEDRKEWRRRVHPEDASRVEEAWELFTQDDARDRHAVTYRLLREDGRAQWIAEDARRIRDGHGRGVRASGLARDATSDVREREERVHVERRMHEALRNESLAHLAGGVAHDFNNTLQVILVASELTREEVPPSSDAHDHLGRIAEAARHAAGLCRQMLAYAGSGRVEIARHDLGDIVRTALATAAPATPANVVVRFDASPDPLPVRGDAANLQQAVLNLVANACDATSAGGGEVVVRTGRADLRAGDLAEYVPTGAMPGDHAYVDVEDRGTGMEPEVVSRLFEPFFSTKFLGRGLGLPAVLGIARAARGGVRVRTRPGEGSSFRLILPMDEHAALGEAPLDRTARRVLVVDDDPDVRAVLAGLLGAMGVEHVACADAGAALEAFRTSARPFDLVLLDLVMPGLPAEHALREMLVLRPDVRIVVMSGLAESEVLRLVGDAPVAGYLHKPFGIAEAGAWIRTIMSSGS